MIEINIEKLVGSVTDDLDESQKKKNLKRNQSKKNWSKENNKKFIETLVIPTSYEEITIKNAKGIETTFKKAYAKDEDIIKAIQISHKNNIINGLHWFNGGHYLFTTDKGSIYNFKRKDGILSKEDKDKIDGLRKELEEFFEEVKEDRRIAEILVKGFIHEDKEVLENPDNFTHFLMGEEEALRFIKKNNRRIEEYKELRKEITDKIKKIHLEAMNKEIFEIHEMSVTNQVRVYISENDKEKFKGLGYKVYSVKSKEIINKWDDSSISFETIEKEKISYYVIMNKKAFVSSCRNDKIPHFGYYYDENGSPKKIQDNSIKVIVDGVERDFESIREAASILGISHTELRRHKQENGSIVFNQKNGIILRDEDGNKLVFKNKSEMADGLETSRVTINNAMKGKEIGDTIEIKGKSFLIVSK